MEGAPPAGQGVPARIEAEGIHAAEIIDARPFEGIRIELKDRGEKMDLFDLNNPDFEVVGGRKRLVVLGREAEFAMVEREPGAADGHSHPNEQFMYFLEGEAEFHVGDEKRPVGPGMLLHIPKDVPHGIEPKTFIRYVTMYIPPRDASVKNAESGGKGHILVR